MADAFTSDTYNALCREAEDYLGRGLTEQARELLLKAVSLIGTRSRARSLLADACMALGLWSEAGEQLEQLITLELGSVQHHYRLGQVLEELQEKDKALDNYRVVLDLEPSHRGASVAVSRMTGRAAETGPEPEPPAGPARMPSMTASGEVQVFPDDPGAEDVFATSGDVENLLRDIGVGQSGEAETGVNELLSSVGINLGPAVEEEKPAVEVTDVSTLMGSPPGNTPGEEDGFSLESVFGRAPEPVSTAASRTPAPAPEPAGGEPFDFTSIFRTALEPTADLPPATPGPSAAEDEPVQPVQPAQAAGPADSEPLLQSIFGEPAMHTGPFPPVQAPSVETPPAEATPFSAGTGSEPILQAVFGEVEPASPAGQSVPEPATGTVTEQAEPEPPLPSIFWEEPPVPGEPASSILEVEEPVPVEPPVSAPPVGQPLIEETTTPAESAPPEGDGDVPPMSGSPSIEASEPEPAEPAAAAPAEPSVLETLPPLEVFFMAGADETPDAGADETPEAVAGAAPVAAAEPVIEPIPVEQEQPVLVQLPAEPAVETPPEGAEPGVDGGAFSLEIIFGAAASGGDQQVPLSGDAAGIVPEPVPAGTGIDGARPPQEPASVDGASAESEVEAPGSMPAAASDADSGAATGGAEVVQTHVPALFDIHHAGQDDLLVVDLIEGGLELKLAYLMAFDSSLTITADGPRRILSGTGMMVLGQAFRSPVTLSLAVGDLVRGDRLVFSDAGVSFAEAGTDLLPSMLRVEGAGGQALAFTGGRFARIPLSGQPVSARAACVLLVPAGAEVSPDPDNPGFIRLEGDGSLLVSP